LTYQSRDVISSRSFIPPTNTQSGRVPVLEITGTTAVTPPLVSMVEKSMTRRFHYPAGSFIPQHIAPPASH
jgi:hypothetical protein